jgi:hypothetical protein
MKNNLSLIAVILLVVAGFAAFSLGPLSLPAIAAALIVGLIVYRLSGAVAGIVAAGMVCLVGVLLTFAALMTTFQGESESVSEGPVIVQPQTEQPGP